MANYKQTPAPNQTEQLRNLMERTVDLMLADAKVYRSMPGEDIAHLRDLLIQFGDGLLASGMTGVAQQAKLERMIRQLRD